MGTILRCQNISVKFGGVTALNGLSIDVEKKAIHGIIGPNGAGKTTLFNVIMAVVKPVNGEIYFEGKKITGLKTFEICKMGIARTHQLVRLFKNMTVIENIMVAAYYGSNYSSRYEQKTRAEQAIKILELDDFKNRMTGSLDFFIQKKVQLARALAMEPKLLLLDEPFAGLNPREVDDIMRLIRFLNNDFNITILLVEHVLRAVMTLSHKITVLNNGEKIFEGTPNEVGRAPQVIEAYLGEAYTT